jgi:parallel beta-helix repeat protein
MNDKPVKIIGDGERGDVVFEANGKDVILFQATMSRIVNLTIRQMGGGRWFGVYIAQGRLDLEGCDITSESLACVAIHGGADPRIRRNPICNGKEAGVVIYENGLGTLEDNEIFGNTNSGVSIFSGGDPTLRRNRIYNGRSAGVVIRENGIGTLEDNEIFGNAFAGIEVKSGGNSVLRRNEYTAVSKAVFSFPRMASARWRITRSSATPTRVSRLSLVVIRRSAATTFTTARQAEFLSGRTASARLRTMRS